MKAVHHVALQIPGFRAELVLRRKPTWAKIIEVLERKAINVRGRSHTEMLQRVIAETRNMAATWKQPPDSNGTCSLTGISITVQKWDVHK